MRVFKARKLFLPKPCLVSNGRLGLSEIFSALGEGFAEIIQCGHGRTNAIRRISYLEN